MVLVCPSAQETIPTVKTLLQWPMSSRPGRAHIAAWNKMPLTDTVSAVSIRLQDLSYSRSGRSNSSPAIGITQVGAGKLLHSHSVAVPPCEQSGTRGGADRL